MRAPGFRKVFGWLRRDGARAVDEELRSHIDMKTEELMQGGLDEAEARRKARARFGDMGRIRREALRVQSQAQGRRRRTEILDELVRDLRFAARGLARDAPRAHAGAS